MFGGSCRGSIDLIRKVNVGKLKTKITELLEMIGIVFLLTLMIAGAVTFSIAAYNDPDDLMEYYMQ